VPIAIKPRKMTDGNEYKKIELKSKYRILIANDDLFQLKMIDFFLNKKFDLNTTTSFNGKMALDIFKQFINDYQNDISDNEMVCYNAIILDLNMPIMGGF
jgi:CheY-like chemotaxis protein